MAEVRFETDQQLDKLLLSNPKMESKVRSIVRKVLDAARQSLRGQVMNFSTKSAHKAIRKSVYKKILGGNLNIITPRWSAGKRAPLPPVRHRLETQLNSKGNHRGGNRMPRRRRTEDLLTYWGADRGFILRFQATGTPRRTTNGVRNVGQIAGNNWFSSRSAKEIEEAALLFDEMMDKVIQEEMSK